MCRALPAVSEERLLKLWEGLGYYNRARNLQKAAVQICEQYHGKFPESYEEWLAFAGNRCIYCRSRHIDSFR